MDHPKLVPGRLYLIVFEHYTSENSSTGSDERVMEVNNCLFIGNVGDWWGFVGVDGIQHRIVNPNHVAYIETHNPTGTESEDFGNYSATETLPLDLLDPEPDGE